jgi:hypothetical protein
MKTLFIQDMIEIPLYTPCEHQNELSFYISPEKLKLYFVHEKNSPTAFADLRNYIITKLRQLQGNQCLIQV